MTAMPNLHAGTDLAFKCYVAPREALLLQFCKNIERTTRLLVRRLYGGCVILRVMVGKQRIVYTRGITSMYTTSPLSTTSGPRSDSRNAKSTAHYTEAWVILSATKVYSRRSY